MREAVNSHALPIYEKNRIASLLCIFETTIVKCIFSTVMQSQIITQHGNAYSYRAITVHRSQSEDLVKTRGKLSSPVCK